LEAQQPPFPVVRSGLPLSAPFDWLRRGAADLRTCGFASLFYGLCFAGTGILLLLAFRHAVQLVTAVTTGFMLVGPVFRHRPLRAVARGAKPVKRLTWRRRWRCGGATSPPSASTR
jgi:uncharacterized membrane protein